MHLKKLLSQNFVLIRENKITISINTAFWLDDFGVQGNLTFLILWKCWIPKKKSFKLNVSCSYITFSSNESAFYNLQFRSRFCHSEVLYNFTVTYIVFFFYLRGLHFDSSCCTTYFQTSHLSFVQWRKILYDYQQKWHIHVYEMFIITNPLTFWIFRHLSVP